MPGSKVNVHQFGTVLLLALMWTALAPRVIAKDAPAKTIRVAIFSGEGATNASASNVKKCLPSSAGFEVEIISAEKIRSGGLEKFDVLIHPGGSGSKQAAGLGKEGRERVKKFVTDGGGFIGICAGAYLASAEYPWSLGLLNARVIDDAHWARGSGDVEIDLTPAGRTTLGAKEAHCSIRYNQGPLLGPAAQDDSDDFESLATFATEVAKKGAPTGVMKGTTAIARGKCGQGRVLCFSPHPEKTPGREEFLQAAVRWVATASRDKDK